MQGTIAESLGIIPHREIDVPFKIWFENYKENVYHIYSFFEDKLCDVHPFCTLDFSDEKMITKFALMLYKSSSKVIK